MPIDIWWYESRKSWCADVPTEKGRKRLYLGPNEAKARAQLFRHMAEYYENLDLEDADSKRTLRRAGEDISLVGLAVQFLNWNKINRAKGTCFAYRDGLKYVTRRHKV